jgi:putative transposase
MAISIARLISQKYQESYTKASQLLEEELEFTMTYLGYPEHHWGKIRTTNLIEGVIKKDFKQCS